MREGGGFGSGFGGRRDRVRQDHRDKRIQPGIFGITIEVVSLLPCIFMRSIINLSK